jgi:hypothetical protein
LRSSIIASWNSECEFDALNAAVQSQPITTRREKTARLLGEMRVVASRQRNRIRRIQMHAVSFKRETASTVPDAFETRKETGRRQDDQRPSGKIA